MEGKTLALAVGMTGAVTISVGMGLLFGFGPPPPPERPKPPPPPESHMNTVLRYSRTVYQGMLEQDAKNYRIKAPTFDQMAKPNPYFEEFKGRRRLKPGDPLTTAHLVVTLEVAKVRATIEGQTFGSDHVVLHIQNRTEKYLAYRVETRVTDPEKCSSKGDLAHNAIAIRPGETVNRTECMHRSDAPIDVTHIEVIEIPALSAYYVSRLPATSVLYETRTAAGHQPMAGELCPQTFSWRDIREGVDARELGWRDVIDFYARHSCEEYSFYPTYRYRTDPSAPLPAKPLE